MHRHSRCIGLGIFDGDMNDAAYVSMGLYDVHALSRASGRTLSLALASFPFSLFPPALRFALSQAFLWTQTQVDRPCWRTQVDTINILGALDSASALRCAALTDTALSLLIIHTIRNLDIWKAGFHFVSQGEDAVRAVDDEPTSQRTNERTNA